MELLVLIIFSAGGFAVLWWFWKASQTPPKRKPRPPYRRGYDVYEDDTGYDSPLGLVDDPDDEWIEWAIMDDMLDDGDGEGW